MSNRVHSESDTRQVPKAVAELAAGRPAERIWTNEIGGSTFRIEDHYVKWNPVESGVDLTKERDRMEWLALRHPAPAVVSLSADSVGQWLVTKALPGEHAVGETWRGRSDEAIAAIATGLRAIHSVPTSDFPPAWDSWVNRAPANLGKRPMVDDPVLVHGDACAPNTLIDSSGAWIGHVDLGDLSVGDRWADLAIASLSLDWNFGEGHQLEFFDSYGIEPDVDRIGYYRCLWEAES